MKAMGTTCALARSVTWNAWTSPGAVATVELLVSVRPMMVFGRKLVSSPADADQRGTLWYRREVLILVMVGVFPSRSETQEIKPGEVTLRSDRKSTRLNS